MLKPREIGNEKFEILQQKKNLTRQDFFGSVAFGQTNYIFILGPEVQKKIGTKEMGHVKMAGPDFVNDVTA
jgi:hypothetical protein